MCSVAIDIEIIYIIVIVELFCTTTLKSYSDSSASSKFFTEPADTLRIKVQARPTTHKKGICKGSSTYPNWKYCTGIQNAQFRFSNGMMVVLTRSMLASTDKP